MSSPVADRVRAYVEEQKRTAPDYSVRQLSLACGWEYTGAGQVAAVQWTADPVEMRRRREEAAKRALQDKSS